MIPSKFQIYRSHFFLNFLCGVLYIVSGCMVFSFPYENFTDMSIFAISPLLLVFIIFAPVVIPIVALIKVNRISYKRFKQHNIKISRVIYPTLTYVGFTIPLIILFLILFIAYKIFT